MKALQVFETYKQAKQMFPDVHLIVGVCGDKITMEKKGPTVMTCAERAESVRHCKWVDQVVEDCPWYITQDFLEQYKVKFVDRLIL